MTEKRIFKALNGLGLSKSDALVYIFLAKKGPNETREIESALNVNRININKSLKELQKRGVVNASIENPLRFVAVPFKEVINLIIQVKKEQAKVLQASKEELLSTWRSITEKDNEKS